MVQVQFKYSPYTVHVQFKYSVDTIQSVCCEVCDNVLHMIVDVIYSTADDVDYEFFHIALKSNHYNRDGARELAFYTKYKTASDNNQHTTYQVHQSIFYNYRLILMVIMIIYCYNLRIINVII